MSTQRSNLQAFNKEKLIFMVGAAGFSLGLYWFLSSGPIPLEAGPPISQEKKAPPPQNLVLDSQQAVDFYVADGSVTRMLDARTGKPVNRMRKSPFQPATEFIQKAKPVTPNQTTPLPPPPPVTDTPKAEPKKTEWDPKTAEAEVEFMGVVMKNGQKYALLRPKDGSSPRRVKIGEVVDVGTANYTVTKIEPQEIWVTDGEKRPFILPDKESDGTSGGGDDDADMDDEEPKPVKKKSPVEKKTAEPKKAEGPAAPHGGEKRGGVKWVNGVQQNNDQPNPNPNGDERERKQRTQRRPR